MKTIILLVVIMFSVGCASDNIVYKYKDREVLVPVIEVESCIKEQIKLCDIEIKTYKDLVECYLKNKNEIEKINNIIEKCNIKELK